MDTKRQYAILAVVLLLSIFASPFPATAQSPDAASLTDREVENLVALAKLVGYVRFFHPSDQAANADWDAFVVAAIPDVIAAEDDAALAGTLQRWFAAMGPTLQVFLVGEEPPLSDALTYPQHEETRLVTWRHQGLETALSPTSGSYSSRRAYRRIPDGVPEGAPQPGEPFQVVLTGTVACRVPLALFAIDQATLPPVAETDGPETESLTPEAYPSSAGRLAIVIQAWAILRHFYPYGEVIGVAWESLLRESLRTAAAVPDAATLKSSLYGMIAQIEDGHAALYFQTAPQTVAAIPPFVWDWVEDQLVVVQVLPGGEGTWHLGDVILAIDGVETENAIARDMVLASGATPARRRELVLLGLLRGEPGSLLTLDVLPVQQDEPIRITQERSVDFFAQGNAGEAWLIREPRPQPFSELAPGVYYIDTLRFDELSFRDVLPDLAGARGLVIDVRGVGLAPVHDLLAFLIDHPISGPQMCTPSITAPEQMDVTDCVTVWLNPSDIHFDAKVVFLTDQRALSSAENFLTFVAAHDLGEIVGSATGGTNGVVDAAPLPFGYVLVWTGQYVLMPDGSPFHGIGIQPDWEIRRTLAGVIEGRDEVLDRGLQILLDSLE